MDPAYKEFYETIYPSEEFHRNILTKYANEILSSLEPVEDDDYSYTSLVSNLTDLSGFFFLNDTLMGEHSDRIISRTWDVIKDIIDGKYNFKEGPLKQFRRSRLMMDQSGYEDYFVEGHSIPTDLKQRIMAEYEDAGFIFTYFGPVNKLDPRVMIYMKRRGTVLPGAEDLPTIPSRESYEIGSNIISAKVYGEFIRELPKGTTILQSYNKHRFFMKQSETPTGTDLWGQPRFGMILAEPNFAKIGPQQPVLGGTGWSKKDIVNAIVNTGLLEISSAPGERKRTKLDDLLGSKGYAAGFGIRKRPLLFKQRVYNEGAGQSLPVKPLNFYTKYYLSKLYYEMIYRKIFDTLSFVDWKQVCQEKVYNLDELKQLAISMNIPYPIDTNYGEICNRLERASEFRGSVKEAITYNIMTSRMTEETRDTRSKMKQKEVVSTPSITEEQRKLLQVCAVPIPQNEMERKAYLFDVISTANSLGILSLFPSNWMTITPEEACRILSSYASVMFRR